MKLPRLPAHFQSGTEYRAEGELVEVSLSRTVRLTDPIYRSIYPHEKNWLDTAFYLKDLKNTVLDFGGATLLLHGEIQPFVLDGCENVTVKNVTVEYARSMMDEAELVEVTEHSLRLRQTEKQKKYFPLRVEDGLLIPVNGALEHREIYMDPHFLSLHDPVTEKTVDMPLIRIGSSLPVIPHESYPFRYYDLAASMDGEDILLTGEVPPGLRAGLTAAQTHSLRDISSVFVLRSKDIRLENYRILNGAGMGILGMYTENLTMDALKLFCDERSHGIAANAADAIHLVSCRGEIRILNSIVEGMKDDGLNVHTNYFKAEAVCGNVIHAVLGTYVQAHPNFNARFRLLGEGDTLAVQKGRTMEEITRLKLLAAEQADDYRLRLTVEGDTSGISPGDTLENLSVQPALTIRDSRFGKAVTHLRIQTRGPVRMENCVCSLQVLFSGDKEYWYEGSPVEDAVFRSCDFPGEGARFRCDASVDDPEYNRGIRIENCRFESKEPLQLPKCIGTVFAGNETGVRL